MGLNLYKKKSSQILLISGIFIILGFFIIFNFSQILKWWEVNFITARASIDAKIRGWAWGENMGWISMNCHNDFNYDYVFENCCPNGDPADCTSAKICQGGVNKGQACSTDGDCSGSTCSGLAGGDYGVYYDTSSERLRGYAWSDKVGWICFGKSCKCADCTSCGDYNTCTSCSGCPDSAKPPHGWPSSWACVGRGTWICSNDSSQTCSNDNGCPGGTCEVSCSGDGSEEFLDISVQNTPCYSLTGETLKAHWTMNTVGSLDSSNQIPKNNGTLMPIDSPPILANGKFENALYFDGINDYIDVPDSPSLSVTGNLVVEGWVKRGSIGSEQTIIGKWDESQVEHKKSYRLWFSADNKLNFSVADTNDVESTITQTQGLCFGGAEGENSTLCSTDTDCYDPLVSGTFCRNAPITDTTKWHHVAGKYIATTSANTASLQLFVDGTRVDVEFPLPTPPNSLSDKENKLYIGAKRVTSSATNTHFNGVIDNVAIWSCANVGFLSGRSAKDIWADAKMEVSGWAKVVSLGDGGWLKLQGATKAGKVWGLYLDDYDTFYTIGGYMANRHADTSMDTTGLVANWLMDEPSWANTAGPIPNGVADSSVLSNNDGTAYGTVPSTDGIFNSAGEFDGIDDYIDCGSNESLEVSTMTIQAWVKRNSIDISDVIISDNITSVLNKDHFLRFEINSADKLAIIFGDGTTDASKYSVGTINDTSWHHVAAVRNNTAKTITFYIDGVPETAQSYTGLGAITTLGINNLWIGRNNVTGSNVFFNGLIDNLAIYNIARTATQILADYNKQNPYCVGWDDYGHHYGDPPAPFDFDNLSINNTQGCTKLIVQWEVSDWAENYTYWRCSNVEESACNTCSYDEYNILGDICEYGYCSIDDAGLSANTGYCYKIQAHNETGSTYNSDGPEWKRTTLCSPIAPTINDDICGEIKLAWAWDPTGSADGYNIYNSLSNANFGIISHLGEGMDYTGLMAQWKMNEASWDGTSGEVRDSSGQTPTNHGTAKNLLTTTSNGKFSYAGDFDGINHYIDCGSSSSLEVSTATVQAWIKRGSINTRDVIIVDNKSSALDKDHHLWFEVNVLGQLVIIFGDGTTGVNKHSTGTIGDTNWHHVAVVRDDSAKTITFYIDGGAETAQLYVGLGAIVSLGNDDMWIGKSNVFGSEAPFHGLIDNLAVYNVARTAEQIKFDYEAGNCGYDDCSLSGECHHQGLDTNCGYALGDESNCTNCPNYVCHVQGNPDGNCDTTTAGDASICCYTDKRILPYVNYYYKTTATSEAGESPFSNCNWGEPAQPVCPVGVTPPCCPWGNTICFPPVETEER